MAQTRVQPTLNPSTQLRPRTMTGRSIHEVCISLASNTPKMGPHGCFLSF